VGDAEVHRHADQGDIEACPIRAAGSIEQQRRAEESCNAFVRLGAPVGPGKHHLDNFLELWIMHVARWGDCIFGAQAVELLGVHLTPSRLRSVPANLTSIAWLDSRRLRGGQAVMCCTVS